MLTVEFTIVGGFLKMQKRAFMQEILMPNSRLRSLLNYGSVQDFYSRRPEIGEEDQCGMITIHFKDTGTNIGTDPGKLLGELKKKYREKLKGRLACKGYLYTFTLDLDSEDDSIQYIL